MPNNFFTQKSRYLGGGQSQSEQMGDKLFGKLGKDLNRTSLKSQSEKMSDKIGGIKKPGESLDLNKKEGFGVADGLGIAAGALDAIQGMKKPELDMSGNTDYGSASNTDLGVTSFGDVAESAIGIGTDLATGNIAGAAIKGAKALFGFAGNGKQKRKIAAAKDSFQNKQRSKSEKAISKISNEDKMKNIVGEDNINYIKNLKNSPGYTRFKRNSQYTV